MRHASVWDPRIKATNSTTAAATGSQPQGTRTAGQCLPECQPELPKHRPTHGHLGHFGAMQRPAVAVRAKRHLLCPTPFSWSRLTTNPEQRQRIREHGPAEPWDAHRLAASCSGTDDRAPNQLFSEVSSQPQQPPDCYCLSSQRPHLAVGASVRLQPNQLSSSESGRRSHGLNRGARQPREQLRSGSLPAIPLLQRRPQPGEMGLVPSRHTESRSTGTVL